MILLCLVASDFQFGISKIAYLLLIFVYSLLIFWGSYFVDSNFFVKVICSVKTDKKQIAITFDDGPATNYTPEILQILKENHVKATFFCIGKHILGNENLLKQIHEEGHIIGNHSFSHHFLFDLFSSKKMHEDLQLMNEITKNVTGETPIYFRPPYGVTTPNLKRAIEKGNFVPIGWNIRSMDTVIKDEQKLLNKVRKALKPGAIILFHDTSKTTLSILQTFINHVISEGYEIVSLDKLLKSGLTPSV